MMIQIIRPKPSEYDRDTESDNENNIGDTKTKEIDSYDRTVAITRYGMRLLGFWPQDTQLLCHLQCGIIFALIVFVSFPTVMRTYIMVYSMTDWNAVMHQILDIILLVPLLSRFIFMKVMAENFRLVLHAMTTDWADYRYLTKRSKRIMVHYARKGRQFNKFNTVFLTLSIIGYILMPIVNMWCNDGLWNVTNRILPTQGFYPFHYKESPVYEMLYVAQSFAVFFGTTVMIFVDCFLYIIVFHICGQFDILAAILKRYKVSIRHHYTKDARNCACLSCIVKRHVRILSSANIIEKSFRDFLLLQLLGYWFRLIFQGHELILYVRHNNINGIVTCILYMLTIMYDIFIYCYISECIIDKSENIGRIAHNLEWQRFPRDVNLSIIVARTRILCKLTTGMFFTLSFPCYTMILMMTILYISVLAAFK